MPRFREMHCECAFKEGPNAFCTQRLIAPAADDAMRRMGAHFSAEQR